MGKSIMPLRKCHFCGGQVETTYLENRRYRYECIDCGKYVEFNAKSQLEADKQFNNTVHLPCEVGGTVYVIYCGYVTSAKVLAVYVDSVGGMFDLKIKTNKENSTGFETIINKDNYKFDDIGKTVFFTHEEAEQALKGERK